MTTPQDLDERFRNAVAGLAGPAHRRPPDQPVRDGAPLTGDRARWLFDAQVTSRHLDLAARWLRSFGEGYYTISSSGHEGNAAVAAAVRPTDPALLHYRSGGFYCVRVAQATAPDAADGAGSDAAASDGPESDAAAFDAADGAGSDTAFDAGAAAMDAEAVGNVESVADVEVTVDDLAADDEAVEPVGAPVDAASGSDPEAVDAASGSDPEAADPAAGSDPEAAGPAAASVPADAGTPSAAGSELPGWIVESARDVLRGVVASTAEPIAGGRHKVFGNAAYAVVPTTSTIASHLPRAVGVGLAIERQRRLAGEAARADPAERGRPASGDQSTWTRAGGSPWPADAIVVCSFGDASVNHASATAAFNTAGWCDHTGLRVPVLFVCEDNGLGISVRSPDGWVAATLRSRPGLRYFAVDGTDLVATHQVATAAAAWVRRHRRPAVLHVTTVRLMGHAGADAEVAYRPAVAIAHDLDRDPLVATARLLVEAGLADPAELLARYDAIGWRVRAVAEEVLGEEKLAGAAAVVGPLAPRRPARVSALVAERARWALDDGAADRAVAFGGRLPEKAGPLTLAGAVNAALTDGLLGNPAMAVFGQDVAAKGGVYGVTKGLRERFGAARVFDTLLDETSVLGFALGAGLTGLLPVPEIQYLAYLHNAEDQVRGEAATMQFFSRGAYRNPLVLRVPGLAYQEGFGGHFHNDNSVAVLRDVPGLVIAVPARPDDAAPMLRTCLASAEVDGSVCVFVEPIALYHTRDLLTDGDDKWLAPYLGPEAWAEAHVPIGRARGYQVGSGEDMTIVTFGNGVRMSLRVAARLAEEGVGTRVVDLRWLAPLPATDLVREASATGRVLVVDETRRSGGVAEGVIATLVDAGYVGSVRRVASVDSYIPLGPAARQVLVTEDAITQGAQTLLAG